jgi:predicted nucleotidyltransferase
VTDRVHYHPNLIFSVGTQVVTLVDIPGSAGLVLHPRGTVGVVMKAPTDHEHSYRVRFPDGFEAPLKRSEVTMLARFKEGEIGDKAHAVAHADLYERVIYRCVIGSQAYGLADTESDVDRRGIYLPTADLVVHTTPEHAELKEIAAHCVTRHHAHHYLGFAETQWKLFENENPPRVKPLLYVYRVLLTGIHLMQTAAVEANLVRLNETARLPYLDELIRRKVAGAEKERLTETDLSFHRGEYERLRGQLQTASDVSTLPEAARGDSALHDLLVRLRLSCR